MKVVIFNTKKYDKDFLTQANKDHGHELEFLEVHLNEKTVKLGFGYDVICAFVNDHLDRSIIQALAQNGTKLIALRCAGFNNVDLQACNEFGVAVLRVPAYSPHGVAEHTVALMLALNRKVYRSHNRVREGNFSLDGLLGFDMNEKTIGLIGTGKIGAITAKILKGFDAKVIAYDVYQNPECLALGVEYVSLEDLFAQSDVISLHTPLMKETYHLIDEKAVAQMKDNVMIVNTSRGGLVDTQAVINGLKSGKIGYLGLDVYEEEDEMFFEDLSNVVIQDDVFARLLTFPNVIITGHQAFFTETALRNIAETTIGNITDFQNSQVKDQNKVTLEMNKK